MLKKITVVFFILMTIVAVVTAYRGFEAWTEGPAFTFAAAGDHGASSHTTASLYKLAQIRPAFYVALGDMSYGEPGDEPFWTSKVRGVLGDMFPFQLIAGNHESDGLNGFIERFAKGLPDRLNSTGDYGKEYYFDYPAEKPLMRMILISPALRFTDGSRYVYDKGTAHYLWTEQAIDGARAAGIPWVVVGMHKPCITPGAYPCEIGTDLFNLLIDKKVDLVLQGHDHVYARSKQLATAASCPEVAPGDYEPECVSDSGLDGVYTKGKGTIFLINGTFGAPMYKLNWKDKEMPFFVSMMGRNRMASYGFSLFRVSEKAITCRYVPAQGLYRDTFKIKKSS